MPLVAEREGDRDPQCPKCVYRTFFNTGKTTARVCENLQAKKEYGLKNPENDGTVSNFIRSFEVGELPDFTYCLKCQYRKEK